MSATLRPSRWLRARIVLDRLVGGLVAIVLSPLVGALAVAVRAQDGHRGIIGVQRVGRGGTPFRMWKIRSMRPQASDGTAIGPSLTSSRDDRITPLGRRLRAYHLDELSQFLNVAAGQMLLLGPRPEAPDWVDLTDPAWRRVLTVAPGIAGPTQLIVDEWERALIDEAPDGDVYGRVVVPVKQAIDAWYVERASLPLDVLIVAAMFGHVVTGRRPRRLERRIARQVPEAAAPLRWLDERSPGDDAPGES